MWNTDKLSFLILKKNSMKSHRKIRDVSVEGDFHILLRKAKLNWKDASGNELEMGENSKRYQISQICNFIMY